jgi:hypothetical protein
MPSDAHHVRAPLACDPGPRPLQFGHRGWEVANLEPGFPMAGPVITHTAINFLPTSMPAHRLTTAVIMACFPSAARSAIRAYVEIFLHRPAHQLGILHADPASFDSELTPVPKPADLLTATVLSGYFYPRA